MEVRIEKLVYGGEGLARANGMTYFVPFVLPGEVVSLVPGPRKKNFMRGRVRKILAPAPERAAPPCPHFGVCGGCHYQHITYEKQLEFKTEILRETLRRLAHFEWSGAIQVHPSPPWAYRNRAQWKVRAMANKHRGGAESLAIGYFQAGSNALCAIEECALMSPLLAKTLYALRAAASAGELPRTLREIEAFADSGDVRLLLTLTVAGYPSNGSRLAENLRRIAPETESIVLHDPAAGRMELFGPGFLAYEAAGNRFRVGHFSFFQVNRFLIEEMVQAVAPIDAKGKLALDLFAGVGLFTLPLMKCFERVVAVESNPASVSDLAVNISTAEGRCEPLEAGVEDFLARFRERPDLVVLDPPRAGLSRKAMEGLVSVQPQRIHYVSCDPSTLARDLDRLVAAGYQPFEMHLLDLFPETFHIEGIVKLERHP